jgi:hypothetical protein
VCYSPWSIVVTERMRARRTGAPPRGRTIGRVHAALTLLAFLVSSLAGMVHEATTRHVQCAEHGEQVHSDAAPAAAVAPALARATDARSKLRDQPAAAIHGHDHCLMASATRASRIAPSLPALGAAVLAHAQLAAAAPQVVRAPGGSLYRTAPKTSPPV